MDATQQIDDSFFAEEEDDTDKEKKQVKKERKPLAALKVFKNDHIPETEVPLYLGENILGRDSSFCSTPLQARSISSRHAVISISVYRANTRHPDDGDAVEALLWDLGSLNGTRKGRIKLTPHVRYALTEGDSVVLADLPCQYISLKDTEKSMDTTASTEKSMSPAPTSSGSDKETGRGIENGGKRGMFPPVPIWGDKEKDLQSPQMTPRQPERTLVPESDSDSDGERDGRRTRKFLVSASSDLSSPTCSTFLTPANKVIPESEDESSITPASAEMGRYAKKEILSEASSGSPKPAPLNFDIDSDTDVEEEEAELSKDVSESKPAVPLQVEPPQVNTVDPACLYMDSDTDVEDEETKSKSLEVSAADVQKDAPAGFNMDSDTDVEENESLKTEASPSSGTKAVLGNKTPTELHMDSDTDVEEEDVPVTTKPGTSVPIPPIHPAAAFHVDSDTDAEEDVIPAKEIKIISESDTDDDPFKPKAAEKLKTPEALTDNNSDTDLEDDATDAQAALKLQPCKDTETATNVSQEGLPHVQPSHETAQDEFRMDSDTDVEEEEEKEKLKEGGKKVSKTVAGINQSSTPRGAGLSEEMETQLFLSPSQPFKRPALPSLLQSAISPVGCSQDSDDFTVAETQSFVCVAPAADAILDETQNSSRKGSSFQLGLSDSSHQQPDADETQAEEPAEEDWSLQSTQLYARTPGGRGPRAEVREKPLYLEATQAYIDVVNQEEEEEEETQPLAEESDSITKALIETRDKVVEDHGEVIDSHPSTADTLILVRSPKLEEPTQPYAPFTAQTLPLDDEDQEGEGEEEPEPEDPVHVSMTERDIKASEVEETETQTFEPDASKNVAVAETQPMDEGGDEEEHEEEPQREETSSSITCRGKKASKVEETQPFVSEASTSVAIAETLPMDEEEHEKEPQKETTRSRRPCGETKASTIEETQPLKSNSSNNVAVTKTPPIDEGGDEKEHKEEPQSDEISSSITCRGKKASKVEETQTLVSEASTSVAIAETLPMDEEEHEEEPQKETTHSRRPCRGKKACTIEETQPFEPYANTSVAIAETLPMVEDEEKEKCEEEPQSEETSNRRCRRGVKASKPEEMPLKVEAQKAQKSHKGGATAKTEPTQPLELDANTSTAITQTEPVGEDEQAQDEEQQTEPRRPRLRRQSAKPTLPPMPKDAEQEPTDEEEQEEEEQMEKSSRGSLRVNKGRGKIAGRIRGRATAEKEGKRKRGRAVAEEEEDDCEEQAERALKGSGRISKRLKPKVKDRLEQQQEEREASEEKQNEENGRVENEMKQRLEQERMEKEEERERKEKEENERKESERKEEEAREQLEKEKIKDKEKLDRLEKEMKENEKNERKEKGKLEKEKKEKEEKDRLEKEKIEKGEREKKEREEKERLQKEKTEKVEKERLEKEKKETEKNERLEREKKEREEKERLEKEKREREETEKEKEELEQRQEKEKGECEEKEEKAKKVKEAKTGKGRALGKRKAGLVRKEEGEEKDDKETRALEEKEGMGEVAREGCEDEKNKKQADAEAKPARGRRTTRKSTVPPAHVEESASDDVPAKRTRSRSNSSNSVSSEQSLSIMEDQSRGWGRGRKPAEEPVSGSRTSSRRKPCTTVSSQQDNTNQGPSARTRSRSNSGSSERSSTTSETPQSKATGRRGRKSVKVEKPGTEAPLVPAAAGWGRGRGGKRPGKGDVRAQTVDEACQEKGSEAMSISEDSVVNQTPSRGRKRGADATVLASESPQPTPKTPRRSVAGPTHKVLFTGVVDEDGEKVLVRLGGGLAKGVGDMTHLVTDKVRRTVKFLCAVARGVPIVTTDWLAKCGKSGTFLSPNEFLVKDVEQERKFNFKLQEALRAASCQPLLQGYEIHVTPSVKPEPAQMKDIITCCGARYLPKMPSAHKPQVVVVSCEEDMALCSKVSSLSVPVVSAEFLLTGILQQKVDLQAYALPVSTSTASKPASRRR